MMEKIKKNLLQDGAIDVENGQFSKKLKEDHIITKNIDKYMNEIMPSFYKKDLGEIQEESKKIIDYLFKHIL